MFAEKIKSSIKTVAPGLIAAALILLPWFLFGAYQSFCNGIRDSVLRIGVVDYSGRPLFSVSVSHSEREGETERAAARWQDAEIVYLSDGKKLSRLNVISDLDNVSARADGAAYLVAGGANIITNGSFESGPWRNDVMDCDEYDKNGAIGMALDAEEKTDGEHALRLEAKRHTACTFVGVPLSEAGDYLFSFDYQSPNASEARFFFSFDDPGRTAVSGEAAVDGIGWQSYAGKIDVPPDATSATLYLYAKATDGETDIINRYDRVYLSKLEKLAAIRPAAAKIGGTNWSEAGGGDIPVLAKKTDGSWQIEAGTDAALPWWYRFLVIAGDIALAAYLGGLVVLGWIFAKRWNLFNKIPKPRWSDIVKGLLLAAADIRRRPWLLIASVLIGLGAVFFVDWAAGALWCLFLVFLLYEWDNRIIGALALVALTVSLLLVLLKRGVWAEAAAVYVFYFMAMLTVLCLIESKRHPTRFYDE